MKYEADKRRDLLDEDTVFGVLQPKVAKVAITPVEGVFAKQELTVPRGAQGAPALAVD